MNGSFDEPFSKKQYTFPIVPTKLVICAKAMCELCLSYSVAVTTLHTVQCFQVFGAVQNILIKSLDLLHG